jgi:hypothetical protein
MPEVVVEGLIILVYQQELVGQAESEGEVDRQADQVEMDLLVLQILAGEAGRLVFLPVL